MFFIALIQVAQQYSSLTTQKNSLAVYQEGMDPHVMLLKKRIDQMSVQPTITLRCWGPFGPWEM